MQQYNQHEILNLLRSDKQKENNEGLKELYRSYFSLVDNLIQRNSGSMEDVEDTFQEGIVVLYNQIKKDNLQLTCQLKTYFYSICRNLWLKKLKQRKLSIVQLDDQQDFVDLEKSIFQTIEINEEKEAMLTLMSHLGEGCQKILLLYYYDRLKMKDIAARMNFANDQVARNKKLKCLKKITRIMENSPFFTRFFK